MLLTVAELRHRVRDGLASLVRELQERTGRRGAEEADAWRASLPAVATAFSDRLFQPLHIYFEERGNLSLEYRLPASSSWCDMVLLGSHANRAAAGEHAPAVSRDGDRANLFRVARQHAD